MKVFIINNEKDDVNMFKVTEDQSIVLKLTKEERDQIGNMPDAKGYYGQFIALGFVAVTLIDLCEEFENQEEK